MLAVAERYNQHHPLSLNYLLLLLSPKQRQHIPWEHQKQGRLPLSLLSFLLPLKERFLPEQKR
jgi:hypothetical protein